MYIDEGPRKALEYSADESCNLLARCGTAALLVELAGFDAEVAEDETSESGALPGAAQLQRSDTPTSAANAGPQMFFSHPTEPKIAVNKTVRNMVSLHINSDCTQT